MKQHRAFLAMVTFLLVCIGCASFNAQAQNPDVAWGYCKEQGGEVEIREQVSDSFEKIVFSVCRFPDGSECGKWMYYFGECQPGQTDQQGQPDMTNRYNEYCNGLGYTVVKSLGRRNEFDICVLPDGLECSAWEFMGGYCGTEYTYCEQNGGNMIANWGGAFCLLPDGTRCPEYNFFKGTCGADGG